MTSSLDVHLELEGVTQRVGQAWFTQRRGGPISTVFAYTAEYLAGAAPIALDPGLPLVSGNQYVDGLPGAFQDGAPDRWGRNLIDKRHRLQPQGDATRALNDVDYLTQVSDRSRQGALRFTKQGSSTFVGPDDEIPKLVELPRLLNAAEAIGNTSDDLAAVKELLAAGSASLGGARPKASVIDDHGRLSIAKFPHREDEWDVMGWECVALDVAEAAGIQTPARQLVTVSSTRRALLLQRFDRAEDSSRIAYISAMTALASRDGQWNDYVDLAETVTDVGANVRHDLAELYRRVVLNVAIHNTDDHMRNHGFLFANGGWMLAPVFDVNPNPDPLASRVTGIAGATTRTEELDGLTMLGAACRLDPSGAARINSEVADAVEQMPGFAARRGLNRTEIGRFVGATLDVRR